MKKKIISIMVACLILMTIPVHATSVNKLQDDLKSNQKTQAETQKKIDANKASVEELRSEITKLDNDIKKVENEILKIQTNINNTQKVLDEVAIELEKAVLEKEEQKATLDERLRVMYMYSDTSVFEILFSASNFSDLITKIDAVKTIADYDQKVFEKLEEMEKEINAKKQKIEIKKQDLLRLKKDSESKKTSLNQVKVTRNDYMAVLKQNTQKLESELNQLAAESNSIKNKIQSLQTINTNINKGVYRWPVPGHTSVSSPYGNRIHPILGYNKFHSGIDIPTGRRRGVNAIAVGNGEVIQSTYSGGYGNMVTIDLGLDGNGNKVSAVYAHLAKRYVGVGKKVSVGEAIGEVGTTGMSTGIHLHFEIRINGETRNPLSYVR
ncbi:peptidoglycan DD-metalloendopeptidase family protein [Alkalibaculum sp. M08DMB]|uniref:Peptidoglycan DD-metalloendopeptidase family protein n=1 Tax=Alkalibaculum sporogenes TaxID=2655001 RepID=A0A6A7K9N2_9FIRM|nr:M23 family metallopeptidase [Alkalibaculum sporogenes]MPW25897.1 peptidoglycan DD-metalloendopeptidase family protein [Alkalibaculum sporogenes]